MASGIWNEPLRGLTWGFSNEANSPKNLGEQGPLCYGTVDIKIGAVYKLKVAVLVGIDGAENDRRILTGLSVAFR